MWFPLVDTAGNRKYLTHDERERFLKAAALAVGEVQTLCSVLVYTGCRMAEALELTYQQVDVQSEAITFEVIRRDRSNRRRSVPVPSKLLTLMDFVHHLQEHRGRRRYKLLWNWSRMTGWRRVHAVMETAQIQGPQASAKGIRHSFGVLAVQHGIPLHLIQTWMGHAQIDTTLSYIHVHDFDAHHFAARLW